MSIDERVPIPKYTPHDQRTAPRARIREDLRQKGRWYVEIWLEEPSGIRTLYGLGPTPGWTEALKIAKAWEREHGKDTARLSFRSYDDGRYKKAPPDGEPSVYR